MVESITALLLKGSLSRPSERNVPAQQEEVVTAERTPVRLKQPVEPALKFVARPYTSKVDRSAVGTPCREQNCQGFHHDSTSAFVVTAAARPSRFAMDDLG